MSCPLCQNASFKELFSFDKAFISSGVLDSYKNEVKKRTQIRLVQCEKCAFIFNQSFDFKAIAKEYSSKNYLSRKIVSSAMSKNIEHIASSILHYFNKAHCVSTGGPLKIS